MEVKNFETWEEMSSCEELEGRIAAQVEELPTDFEREGCGWV